MRETRERVRKALIARRDAITGLVEGMVLVNADIALDQARRLAFSCYFDGRAFEDTADALGCDRKAREIARKLEGMNLMQSVQVLERVRWGCWRARYRGRPVQSPGGKVH